MYPGENTGAVMHSIFNQIRNPIPDYVDPDIKRLIYWCLEQNPENRITCAGILEYLDKLDENPE